MYQVEKLVSSFFCPSRGSPPYQMLSFVGSGTGGRMKKVPSSVRGDD